MTPGLRAGLIVGGGVVALGSASYLVYDLFQSKGATAPSSSGQVSLQVLGYEVFQPGAPESVSASGLQPSASVGKGDSVGAVVQVTNLGASPLAVGIRGWIIQAGYQAPGSTLVAPMVTGTVEGHMFPATNPTSASTETGSETVPGSSLLSKGRIAVGFFSAPVTGGAASSQAFLSTVGILWAAGPLAAVTALPQRSGTLPTGQGIAYVWQPNAIQATFNLVGAVRALAMRGVA